MRTGLTKRIRLGRGALIGAAGLLAFAASPVAAKNYDYSSTEINQKDAGGYASNNYYNGSGDSKDEGVRNAMRAMNRLASLDIGGAIHYGYKGYGNYTNSQRMDDLDTSAWNKKGSMDSYADPLLSGSSGQGGGGGGGDGYSAVGPEGSSAHLANGKGGSNSISNITNRSHMLSAMDRGFLYRGETGDVAAEFEKRSGMSRETFFNELAATEASGLSWDDPNIMARMESRYHEFIEKIPNKDYRANIEKMHDMFNFAKKTQVIEEAAAFYKKNRWGDGGDKVAQQAQPAHDDAKASETAAPGQGGPAGDRSPASDLASAAAGSGSVAKGDEEPKLQKLSKEQMGMYLGLEGTHADDLKDMVGPEDTIFRTVSKRYRKLTPMLIGKIL